MILFKVAGLSFVEKGNNFEWFMRYFIFEVSIIQDSESGSWISESPLRIEWLNL